MDMLAEPSSVLELAALHTVIKHSCCDVLQSQSVSKSYYHWNDYKARTPSSAIVMDWSEILPQLSDPRRVLISRGSRIAV